MASEISGSDNFSSASGGCSAWVDFDGATAAIKDQHNIASVVRNSTGEWTLTFTTALADANYAIVGSSNNSTGNRVVTFPTKSTTGFTVKCVNFSSTDADAPISIIIFGGK